MSLTPSGADVWEDGAAAMMARHDAILQSVAARVSATDGSRPGGALIGPRLLLLATRGMPDEARLISLATAIEMTRRATLAHRVPKGEDVWQGLGETRLSRTLLGDTLLAEAFRILAIDGEPRVIEILARAMASVATGEMARHGAGAGDLEGAIARLAAYYEGVAEMGALLGGLGPSEAARFTEWARALGERHERALRGQPPSEDAVAQLRRGAPPGADALADRLLAQLGAADALTD